MRGMKKIQKKYPKTLGEVRGKGLMVGLELVRDETITDRTPDLDATNKIMEETKKRGLLIGRGGLYGNCLRIAPALNISSDDIDEAIQIVAESFGTL
jgi:4-aminobutyrate aminotransferase-like enzyme